MNFTKNDFGPNFNWGVSTAAYQIEGAWNEDGKGPSVWDVFSNSKGKTSRGENANIACDFYHRYQQDLEIMQGLGIRNYRFSLSWSRIMPKGIGEVNAKGIDFYNRVIDTCLSYGIEPWITLYHWDLPHNLELKGGWTNREVMDWFANYVQVCVSHFGDRVKHWMILNEPMVFTGAGYFLGIHAPGKKGLKNFFAAAHHAAMCQAEGGRIVRSMLADGKVGTTFSCSLIHPFSKSKKDELAAHRADILLNRLFVEPLAGLGYPVHDLKLLQRLENVVKDGDEQKLAFDMDFIGIQNYTREIVTHSWFTPLIWVKVIGAHKRKVETTEMNWEVYPESMYEMLLKFSKYKNFKEIIVTESGAAFPDVLVNGAIPDVKREDFLKQKILQVLLAKQSGVNVNGYFAWSFTDNFEWAEGYRPRFGLVYIDFETQKRTIKNSGHWFSSFIKDDT